MPRVLSTELPSMIDLIICVTPFFVMSSLVGKPMLCTMLCCRKAEVIGWSRFRDCRASLFQVAADFSLLFTSVPL